MYTYHVVWTYLACHVWNKWFLEELSRPGKHETSFQIYHIPHLPISLSTTYKYTFQFFSFVIFKFELLIFVMHEGWKGKKSLSLVNLDLNQYYTSAYYKRIKYVWSSRFSLFLFNYKRKYETEKSFQISSNHFQNYHEPIMYLNLSHLS